MRRKRFDTLISSAALMLAAVLLSGCQPGAGERPAGQGLRRPLQFAAEAAKVVRTATADATTAATQAQIQHAVESREIVARAEGALMAHDHLTEERARTVLRQVARSTRRPLKTVSQKLLADLSGGRPSVRRKAPSAGTDPASGTTSSSGLGGSADEGPSR